MPMVSDYKQNLLQTDSLNFDVWYIQNIYIEAEICY